MNFKCVMLIRFVAVIHYLVMFNFVSCICGEYFEMPLQYWVLQLVHDKYQLCTSKLNDKIMF